MEKIGIIKSKRFNLPVKTDPQTLNSHIWFTQHGERYMFKYSFDDEYDKRTILNEVLVSKICKFLDLPCQEAFVAKYIVGNVDGVKIKSFLKPNEREISLLTILNEDANILLADSFGDDFFEENIYPYIPQSRHESKTIEKKHIHTSLGVEVVNGKFPTKISLEDIKINPQNKINLLFDIYLEQHSPAVKQLFDKNIINEICNKIFLINKINTKFNEQQTLESIIDTIQNYAERHNYSVDPELRSQLIKMLIFDYFVMQTDRHLGNISLILNEKTLRLAPLFDNGHCLIYNSDSIHREKLQYFQTKLTADLLKTKTAKQFISQLSQFLKNDYNTFAKQLVENSKDLLELTPKTKTHNANKPCVSSKKIETKQDDKKNARYENGNLFDNELSDAKMFQILHANTEWLKKNGIEYTPKIWLATYLYACGKIMEKQQECLEFMFSESLKTNDNYELI